MKKVHALLSRFLLACISLPLLSRLWGKLTGLRRPRFLSRRMIKSFKNHYRIDMSEFAGSAQDYPSLADFFVRPLDPLKRPLSPSTDFILSPADGKLSELERVNCNSITQVKGKTYPLSRFLATDVDFAQGWYIATIYLSPCDYHRFHFPVSGRISGCFYGGTRLFPVNPFSCAHVRNLYIKNERLITRMELNGTSIFVAAVGATFVGSIAMTYLPDGLPAKNEWNELSIPATQLVEMGRFNMGSTIVMVLPAALVEAVIAEKGKPIRVGDPLLKIAT
ncbi:MAG: phosphatidylserine decarboxylase [Candidatus Aminicenantes bacterium]|nr:phosphatidylserine decarboxylase [Candidatus Aminicenantes bacterium]